MGKTSKQLMIKKKFGTLTVESEVFERNKNGHILYNVVCDCGKQKQVLGSSLRSGASRSCNKCFLLTGSHGMYKTREYSIWQSMKDRCYNPNNISFKNYGAKGIFVCERWINSFANFLSDMGESKGLSIDRINVYGNYEPSNCRWATPVTQARNRTNNKIYSYLGETLCASEWCKKLNMPSSTFNNRINRGWSIEETIIKPIIKKHCKRLEYGKNTL
jgi:hypothetical protein